VRLYAGVGGPALRTLDTNPVYEREQYKPALSERVQIKTADGFLLEGVVTRPSDFDPKKKYPVWVQIYGGPRMPTIRDSYGARSGDQRLASQGFIVFRVDPRSGSGKGACSAWTAFKQLGVQETKDLDEAVDWLCRKYPQADPKRIGISGHSYGGYLTAFVLTHSTKFAAGAAGAPVTDWRNYDSIYTERYMLTPRENPDGYDKSSVVKAARNLHGKLLLMHGLMDDNVHAQNTVQLIDALQRAGKDYELLVFPRARHGFGAQRQILDFMKRSLGGPE
jgi:dipeptidyl-peptidase-4